MFVVSKVQVLKTLVYLLPLETGDLYQDWKTERSWQS